MFFLSVELSHYDINYVPRGSIKSQVLVVFLDEFSSLVNMEVPYVWTLSVYGPSTLKGSDTCVILESPGTILIELSMRFEFKANNN